MRLQLVSREAFEAVDFDGVKAALRLNESSADDETDIQSLIIAARIAYETFTERKLISSVWDLYRDSFPRGETIWLPSPLQSVESVKYQDPLGIQQTLDPRVYVVDAVATPQARLTLAYCQSWPTILPEINSVVIRLVAGYISADAIPEDIKRGMYLWIQSVYDGRDDLRQVAESFWWPYRNVPL